MVQASSGGPISAATSTSRNSSARHCIIYLEFPDFHLNTLFSKVAIINVGRGEADNRATPAVKSRDREESPNCPGHGA